MINIFIQFKGFFLCHCHKIYAEALIILAKLGTLQGVNMFLSAGWFRQMCFS